MSELLSDRPRRDVLLAKHRFRSMLVSKDAELRRVHRQLRDAMPTTALLPLSPLHSIPNLTPALPQSPGAASPEPAAFVGGAAEPAAEPGNGVPTTLEGRRSAIQCPAQRDGRGARQGCEAGVRSTAVLRYRTCSLRTRRRLDAAAPLAPPLVANGGGGSSGSLASGDAAAEGGAAPDGGADAARLLATARQQANASREPEPS